MKIIKFALNLVVCIALLAGCLFAVKKDKSPGQDFGLIQGKSWQLVKVSDSKGGNIFDRAKIDAEKFADIYTIQFDAERAFGKAAPNRYNAPYSANKTEISFKPAISTKMLGLFTPEGLSEDEFYKLLENAKNWNYSGNSFSIGSLTQAGASVTLFFIENSTKN